MHFSVTYIILLNVSEPKVTTATMKLRDFFVRAWYSLHMVKWQFMQQAHERERACHFLCCCTCLHHWVVNIEAGGWETGAVAGHVFFFFSSMRRFNSSPWGGLTAGYRMCCSRFSETNKGEFWFCEQRNTFACIHFIWPTGFFKKKRELFEGNIKSVAETQTHRYITLTQDAGLSVSSSLSCLSLSPLLGLVFHSYVVKWIGWAYNVLNLCISSKPTFISG